MNGLVTGHNGFLGQQFLQMLAADHVFTVDRSNADNICDLSKQIPELRNIQDLQYVLHLAGKAHSIPRTFQEEKAFFNVNFEGTKNLCAAIDKLPSTPKAFVFISTVAVYGLEAGNLIKESYPLNGATPYARSKILAEDFLRQWAKDRGITLAIFRLPLIAGPNPPGNLGAMISGIKTGRYFRIGTGAAKKSIVLASDVAKIIPKAAEVGGSYNLTDGYHPAFSELEEVISQQLGKKMPKSIPLVAARVLGWAGDVLGSRFPVNSDTIKKITSDLTFDDSKAREKLGWSPSKVLDHFKIA